MADIYMRLKTKLDHGVENIKLIDSKWLKLYVTKHVLNEQFYLKPNQLIKPYKTERKKVMHRLHRKAQII